MTKLTLVSFMCNRKVVTTFVQLPIINDKPVISNKLIDHLFMKYHKFTPQRGDTISHL